MSLPTLKIIEKLATLHGQVITVHGLAQAVSLDKGSLDALSRFLDMLVAAGMLRHQHQQRYELRKPVHMVEGLLSVQASGAGFLTVTGGAADSEDIYISSFHLDSAMDGDSVVAVVLPKNDSKIRGGRRRRAEGLIVAIKQRAHKTVLGLCKREKRGGIITCHSLMPGMEFQVTDKSSSVGKDIPEIATLTSTQHLDGKYVVLSIDRYPQSGLAGLGHVIKELGAAGQPLTDIMVAAYRQGLPTEFPNEVEEQARQLARAVGADELAGRVDLRALPLVTIDGADARDFDDAVALETVNNGWRLWVAIADVSHYVKSGSTLDSSAHQRGTSVYFPGFCLPMLPESLSNGICSLKPDEDRLVVAVKLEFASTGELSALEIMSAVMRSKARLTYDQVQSCLMGSAEHGVVDEIVPMLQQMAQLAQALRNKRQRRGALDFDLPEADIRLDPDGAPTYIGRRERTDAHRLIEEFMLAANESVAQWVEERSETALYRVHDAPDMRALQSLQQFVAAFNLGFNIAEDGIDPKELQQLLHQIKNTEQEYIVNQILLRSMAQAQYSADNSGHFGLASSSYCHFTSPIRRYPDLVQHRMVLNLLTGAKSYTKKALAELASYCTMTERRAMLAERDVVDLRKCQFMHDKIGLRYSGFITSVAEFGLFVVLNEFFVEGLVHIRTLSDDFYTYEADKHRLVGQGKRNIFQLGMAVNIEVAQVRPDQRQIDFVLLGMAGNNGQKKDTFAGKKLLRRSGSAGRQGKVARKQVKRRKK